MSSKFSIPIRSRRLRRSPGIRRLFSETSVSLSHLVAPLFVKDGSGAPTPIPSLPGHFRHSISSLLRHASRLANRGVGGIAIFPCIEPSLRTKDGRTGLNPKGLIPRTLRALKKELPDLPVFADVAVNQ